MRPALAVLLIAAALLAACDRRPVVEDDPAAAGPSAAVAGDTLPLARILDIAVRSVPGEVVKVELEDEHGVLTYELEILTDRGRLIELRIDARTGVILKREAE